jgi:hypothetical protein
MIDGIFEENRPTPIVSTARKPLLSRYFIELHVAENDETPRILMDQIRRHKALEFIQVVRDWIKDNELADELSALSITAMGQVMIVCSHHMIDLIREQDIWAIAHIRSSSQAGDLRSISGKV